MISYILLFSSYALSASFSSRIIVLVSATCPAAPIGFLKFSTASTVTIPLSLSASITFTVMSESLSICISSPCVISDISSDVSDTLYLSVSITLMLSSRASASVRLFSFILTILSSVVSIITVTNVIITDIIMPNITFFILPPARQEFLLSSCFLCFRYPLKQL